MKNGFTLVELLTVMVILSILVIITIPAYRNISENVKSSNLETIKQLISNATLNHANKYLLDEIKPSNNDCSDNSCCKYYSIRYIAEQDIYHSNDRRIIDPITNHDLEGYIKVSYNTDKYALEATYVANKSSVGNCEVVE